MKKELIGLYDMAQEIYEDGLREGREEGRQEGHVDAARNMLCEGLEMDIVVKCTGLSREEVERLQRERN